MFPSKSRREQGFHLIKLSSTAYVISITTWFILWLTIGDKNWWLTILNRIVPYLFLPIPLLLILLIAFHSVKWTIQLLVPILIFCILYSPYLFPRTVQTNRHPNLSIITYNVLFSNSNYDAVAQVILAYKPDFVTFQEIQPTMMDELKQRLDDAYPYSIMGPEHPFGTTAIFSRHPGIDSYILNMRTDRSAVIFETEINQTRITIISAHLLAYGLQWVKIPDMPKAVMARTMAQNTQVQRIVDEIQRHDGLVILGCDCNSKETSSSYRILANTMNNSAHEAGWSWLGATLESTRPDINLQHIDYVFYRGQLEPLEVLTIDDSGGSDHSPILALFEVSR